MPKHVMRPAAPQTREIIGRTEETQKIQVAIEGTGTRVLHIVGEGGIGKTRQLREVDKWYAAQVPRPFEWLGLIDLYHSDLHSPSVIERQIVGRIDPDFETDREHSPFKVYLNKRERFEDRRRQGLVKEEERLELTQAFIDDYNNWAADHRAVIAFDTLELIVYETDEVVQICEGEAISADVKGWMTKVLPQLQNTVILLASRPHRQLERELEESFAAAQVPYQHLELVKLSKEDTLAYLKDIVTHRPQIQEKFQETGISPTDIYEKIWQYTNGVPILLSLLIDLAAFGDVAALYETRDMTSRSVEDKVLELLAKEFRNITPPIWDTLRCLAVARKGLTPDLFQQMVAGDGWSLDQCREELDRLRGAAFVKSREGTEALFLHDVIYTILDETDSGPLMEPGRLLPVIIDYYDEQIKACEAAIEDLQDKLRKIELRRRAGAPSPVMDVQQHTLLDQLAERERERQRLLVEKVYYALWYDAQDGFELYAKLYNQALKAHKFGFEARLHDELLRYLSGTLYETSQQAQRQLPRGRFHRHCALRWLKYHLARADRVGRERTVRVARRLLEMTELPLGGAGAEEDLFYQAELRLWGAEALLYQGAEDKAQKWLEQALALLERTEALRSYVEWRRNRLIGRVHNDFGYLFWQSARYSKAVEEYRAAIPHFRQADILDELADTLNNLAYVYSVRGEMTRAKPLIENARLLRERLGRNYLLALSYNTTGEIHTAADEPEDALAWCERARQIFATVEEPRGLGLSYIALGRAHRKFGDKGKRGQYPFEQTQREFEQAETYLNKALAIFGGDDPSVEEPYRLWETLNELGSTYVDWGYLLTWYNLQEQMNEKYHLAVKYQEEAIEKAKKAKFLLPLLDSYDDLAQAYADWGKPEQAEEYLEKIYREVPQEYRLVAGEGFPEITDPVDGYWRVLGKYHLQRGIWAYREAEQAQEPARKDSLLDETVRHFALAIAYFQKFSPAIAQVVSTQHAMYRRFTTLELERLDRLRQKVEEVAQDYNVDLGYLLDTLDDTLGAPLHL